MRPNSTSKTGVAAWGFTTIGALTTNDTGSVSRARLALGFSRPCRSVRGRYSSKYFRRNTAGLLGPVMLTELIRKLEQQRNESILGGYSAPIVRLMDLNTAIEFLNLAGQQRTGRLGNRGCPEGTQEMGWR